MQQSQQKSDKQCKSEESNWQQYMAAILEMLLVFLKQTVNITANMQTILNSHPQKSNNFTRWALN